MREIERVCEREKAIDTKQERESKRVMYVSYIDVCIVYRCVNLSLVPDVLIHNTIWICTSISVFLFPYLYIYVIRDDVKLSLLVRARDS